VLAAAVNHSGARRRYAEADGVVAEVTAKPGDPLAEDLLVRFE
jgi:hypothetical protein